VRSGSVFLPILFTAMTYETANQVRGEDKIPDMKTSIFSENVLILEDKRQSEEKLNKWNIIFKNVV
jgi:hypothetical protein